MSATRGSNGTLDSAMSYRIEDGIGHKRSTGATESGVTSSMLEEQICARLNLTLEQHCERMQLRFEACVANLEQTWERHLEMSGGRSPQHAAAQPPSRYVGRMSAEPHHNHDFDSIAPNAPSAPRPCSSCRGMPRISEMAFPKRSLKKTGGIKSTDSRLSLLRQEIPLTSDFLRRNTASMMSKRSLTRPRMRKHRIITNATDIERFNHFMSEKVSPHMNALQKLTSGQFVDSISAVVICLNMIAIGVQVDVCNVNEGAAGTFRTLAFCFVAFYSVEFLLRLCAERSQFVCGENARWNACDVLLLVVGWFEVALVDDTNLAALSRAGRLVRILRAFRAVRLLRFMRYVREFRKMVYAMVASLATLCWSLLLLCCNIYVFSVVLTQGVTEWAQKHEGVDDPAMQELLAAMLAAFGTLPCSTYSLFASITGGRSWCEVATPLMQVDFTFLFIFVLYITISVFGLLNVLTSIFVDSAMQSTNHYRELLVQEKQYSNDVFALHMREVFKRIDEDESGCITLDELEIFLGDPDLRIYLQALEIDLVDTTTLFKLLDHSGDGRVNIDEFCEGCMRLHGDAKSFDIHCMMLENEKLMSNVSAMTELLEDVLPLRKQQQAAPALPAPRFPLSQGPPVALSSPDSVNPECLPPLPSALLS